MEAKQIAAELQSWGDRWGKWVGPTGDEERYKRMAECANAGSVAVYENDQLRAEVERLRGELATANERQRIMCKPPSHCPVTGRPFFMILEGEDGEEVATYGGPFDSYTIPEWSASDAEFRSERYDHDAGYWIDGGEPYPFILVDESEQNGFIADLDAATIRAEAAEKERDEWRTKALDVEKHPVVVALLRERNEAQALVAGLRGALEEIAAHGLGMSVVWAKAALALTPASAGNRLKAEAYRDLCDGLLFFVDADVKQMLRMEAARLTAEAEKEAWNAPSNS